MVKECGLGGTLTAMLSDKRIYRSQQALGPAYERPDAVSDATIEPYLRPFVSTEKRTQDLARFVISFDNKHTVTIESKLKTVRAPTLIIWGDDDVYFDVKWSQWLEKTLPNVKRRVIFKGARLFFPEERAREFNDELRAFWN